MTIGWESQKFPPGGASAGEGIRNQLGRPPMNLLTILVREAAQNSWDAGVRGEPVSFDLDLMTLRPDIVPRWRKALGQGAPSKKALPLRDSLQDRVRVLTVSDRGTVGLGGPTRADNAIVENNDFVAFIRNVGEPRDTALGGGTYGFGKGIFYLLSRCGTVLVYTRCRVGKKKLESRLIACSLWKSYTVGEGTEGTRYTGRHWWGDTSGEIVEPILDDEADRLAEHLGLPGFAAKETGTTIAVIDPILDFEFAEEDEEEEAAVDWMSQAVAWHLWPKIIPATDGGAPAMNITVRHNGTPVEIPNPEKVPPLNRFVRAYRALNGPNSVQVEAKRPKQVLGRAAFSRDYLPPFEDNRVAEECGFTSTSHHVCLMRSPELVVKYLPGPKPGVSFISYAGVFRADDAVDEPFAQSEPPTHDDWVSSQLEVPGRTFVNVALRRIKELAREQVQTTAAESGGVAENVPLGAASRRFSLLISSGKRLETQSTNGSSTGGRSSTTSTTDTPPATAGAGPKRSRHRATRTPRVTYLGEPTFREHDGEWLIAQDFTLTAPLPADIVPNVNVIIPGVRGRERDAPINAAQPIVIGWTRSDGTDFNDSPSLRHPGDGSTWRILVRPAPDTGTEIELAARNAGDQA